MHQNHFIERSRVTLMNQEIDVLVWWIWLPSASAWVVSVIRSAEKGAPFTTGPCRPGSAPTRRGPQLGAPPWPGGWADAAATASRPIARVRIDILLFLFQQRAVAVCYQSHGARHAIGAEHHIGHYRIGSVFGAGHNSQRHHGGAR